MRHEVIMSYEIVDGKETGYKREGELIRCGDCIHSRTTRSGMKCGCQRKSPMGYCDEGKRNE